MDITAIRKYAPAARRDFIYAVTARANALGISENDIKDAKIEGDVAIIGGRAFPADFAARREKIVEAVRLRSFSQVVEEAAYTWFNRIVAIRYMEVNDFLPLGKNFESLGINVLCDRSGDFRNPEILTISKLRSTDLKICCPPCTDSSMPRCVRLNSVVPSWLSNCLMACDTAGWLIYSSSAALVRLPHFATV